ncbi:MAG: prepilin-type N-terminal cleavage/methylation domain-containing protein [Cyanobacteria bacterium P01_A01_bin.135]
MLPQILKSLSKAKLSRRSNAGFTLFELLIVVLIISIIAVISAPSWGAIANRQKAKRAVDQLRQAVRQTQSETRRLRSDRPLEFDTGANTLSYPGSGSSEPVSLAEGDLDADVFTFTVVDGDGAPITQDTDGDGLSEIWFSANGGLDINRSNEELPIYLSVTPNNSNATRCIVIRSLIGGIDLERNAECVGQ